MKFRPALSLPFIFLFMLSQLVTGQTENKKITLDDMFKKRTFSSKGTGKIVPMNNGEHYCQLKNDSLNIYEYATGKITGTIVTHNELIPPGDSTPIELGDCAFSLDESRLLLATDEEPIYRYSSRATYYVFDRLTKKLIPVSGNGKQSLCTFSPDGNQVAFVRDNNLFISFMPDLKTGTVETREIQITFDGKKNAIINGMTDWVYEEEFGFTQAFFWSPDGKKIAWYRFDETNVKEYQLTYYGDLYPEQYHYKYPKAGEANSVLSIHIIDLNSRKTITVDLGKDTDIYIPRIQWTRDPDQLALYRMNRHQNRLELLLANALTESTKVVYIEENKYYIDITDHLTFLENGKEFLLTSEKDGFRHLYLYSMDGNLVRQLTKGNWEVEDILGVDEKNGLVYFSSTETSPLDRDISAVSLNGNKLFRLSSRKGTNKAEFCKSYNYYIGRWSDINTPPVIAVYDSKGNKIREIQDNAKLKETMQGYRWSPAEFFSFKTPEGIDLNGFMLKPPDFDSGKKYPVLFTIYGGPGSQTVTNNWGTVSTWNQLWAQNGIIVVSVDNRGTGGRGDEFKKCTYLQLGKFETLDQIEAAKYLSNLPYIDSARIGMWGWSFGGYLTLSCLTRGADYFSAGIAVAPVTNWKYYDNIYTERFMRTPAENPGGYEQNSPVNHAAEFKGKLLMIHGMADDNVHPQNSYDMFAALVAAGKTFDSEFYPNSNHGIYSGKGTTIHLYRRMTDFILDVFPGPK
jgi:dipeptidyl-peptidase-4